MSTGTAKKQPAPKTGSSTGPSPTKRARTAAADGGKTPSAQAPLASSSPENPGHPTLTWMSAVLHTLADDLETLATESASAFGGIGAFCPTMYKTAMSEHGEYECNLTLHRHAILRTEHADVWPVVGAIKRLVATVFRSENGDPSAVFPHAISVRAVSSTDAPEQCERLHRSAYLFAFLASWADAKKTGRT